MSFFSCFPTSRQAACRGCGPLRSVCVCSVCVCSVWSCTTGVLCDASSCLRPPRSLLPVFDTMLIGSSPCLSAVFMIKNKNSSVIFRLQIRSSDALSFLPIPNKGQAVQTAQLLSRLTRLHHVTGERLSAKRHLRTVIQSYRSECDEIQDSEASSWCDRQHRALLLVQLMMVKLDVICL